MEIFTIRTQCRATANDIVQDAFAIALEKGRGSSEYLYGIAKNRLFAFLRKQERVVSLDEDLEDDRLSPAEAVDKETMESELQSLIKDLSPADRELLIRIAVEEHSQKEIADDIGTTPATLRKRWERLRGRLRKVLAPIAIFALTIGMIGGSALTLMILESSLVTRELGSNLESSSDEDVAPFEPPRAIPDDADVVLVEPAYRYVLEHIFRDMRRLTLDLCVYGKDGRSYNPDLQIDFIFGEKLVGVKVRGKRSVKIKKCIEREVMPRFLAATVDVLSRGADVRGLHGFPNRFDQGQFTWTIVP